MHLIFLFCHKKRTDWSCFLLLVLYCHQHAVTSPDDLNNPTQEGVRSVLVVGSRGASDQTTNGLVTLANAREVLVRGVDTRSSKEGTQKSVRECKREPYLVKGTNV